MPKTINYDKHIVNLISALSKTGHVTHRSYRKTSVTLHHNAGNLSIQGCLNVWKKRPASAHFQSDSKGRLGQYVKVNEYAWAAGNTRGNQTSIHIEMANSTRAPHWNVKDVTWQSACRLAGWLYVHEIGARPRKNNFHVHHDWYPTSCAGPFIDSIMYSKCLSAAQASYDHFKGHKSKPRPAPSPSKNKGKSTNTIVGEVLAGKWGNGSRRKTNLQKAGYNYNTIQRAVNEKFGISGAIKSAPKKKSSGRKSNSTIAAEVWYGKWGNGASRNAALKKAGYNPNTIQTLVNRGVGKGGGRAAPARTGNAAIAKQVIAGKWGNGADRKSRLQRAGYNYHAIQALVNRHYR